MVRALYSRVSQLPPHVTEFNNTERFTYNKYLAISEFVFLSNVLGVDACLDEQCGFLGQGGTP